MVSEQNRNPEYHRQRKEEGLRGIRAALDTVCARLGYEYRVLDVASDSSRAAVVFARRYDTSAVKALENFSGEPHIAFDWGDGERVKISATNYCNDIPCIGVEIRIYNPNFDREMLDALFLQMGQVKDACIIARWTVPFLVKLAEYYQEAISKSAQLLAWQVHRGFWEHDELTQTSDRNTWELWGRAPVNSGARDVRMFLYPNVGSLTFPSQREGSDNPLTRQFIDTTLAAVKQAKQELEEKPLWTRSSPKIGLSKATPNDLQAQGTSPEHSLSGKTWQGKGKPPETRSEKIQAMDAWDALDADERPRQVDWLLKHFGSDPATGTPYVPASTFRGWRKLKNKNSS